MTQLDDDAFERNVFYETDNSTTDTYQVVDPNDSDYTFVLEFPYLTAEWYAYIIINQIPVRGTFNPGPFVANDVYLPWLSGRTADRPNIQPVLGMIFFDLDLGKPIWFVGSGPTGWIDASGEQV